jgi:hypothetical protein
MLDISAIVGFADAMESDGLHRYLNGAPGQGGMSPAQRAAHMSPHGRRILIGGNQIGKTRFLAAESWWLAGAFHPFRESPAPGSIGWIVCADLRAGWPNISRKLREIEPPGILDPRQKYDDARGYTFSGSKLIRLKSGSLIFGKSGSQDLIALSGATIDWLAFDEVPKIGHYSEARSRVAVASASAAGGPVIMGFTPIGRPVDWLRDTVEGNPETGATAREDWDIHRVPLTAENCPHRTPEDIQAQIDSYGPWEYRQRVLGEWDGVSVDRWIPGFSELCIFGDDEAPQNVEAVGLGWDHGERPGASVCYLVAWTGERLWVLAEYCSEERNTPKAEAIAIRDMLRPWGIGLHQIDEARGDSNSAGRLGLGLSVNETLERAFADLAGSSRPPFAIRVPYKGRGSIKARARLLNAAAVDGRFRVHESCTKLIHSLRHWRGQNDDLKHPFDGVAYIADVYLSPGFGGESGRLLIA